MSDTQTTTDPRGDKLERAVEDLFSVGRMWASYGLRVGELALSTSARTLRTTATSLGAIAEHLHDELEAVKPESSPEDGSESRDETPR